MPYLTDRKRAAGSGASGTGTEHFWNLTKSSAALLILVPLFVFTFGPMLGEPHPEVILYFSRPFPALVAALTLVVGFYHFAKGCQVLIEDYTRGLARKVWIVAIHGLSYTAAAVGLFGIARIAL